MSRFHAAVIRVVTLEDPAQRDLHGNLIAEYEPELCTVSHCIPDQPHGIYDRDTKALAVPKILAITSKFDHPDVVIVSCCDDPGVPELRQRLSIPVVGAGSAVCGLARCFGDRIGVVGITSDPPEPYSRILGNQMLYLGRPDGVHCTWDLQTQAGRQAVLQQALELRDRGAELLALACTGMSTISVAEELRNATGMRVIDPVQAEALAAAYACTHPISI